LIETEKTYVHGTAAKKLEYNVYEENKVLKAKRKQKSNNRAKFNLILSILVVFAFIFLVIYRYALITDLNYSIDKSIKNYNEIKNENSILKVDIEKDTDLSKIRQIAEDKLGMHKPDKFQVIYVNVPKSDYSIVSQTYSSSGKNANLFGMITDKLEKLTHLIY
jgi:cell division protein FtsL